VNWIESDVTGEWDVAPVDIWHDRAVFHFLTDAKDRARYVRHLSASLRPGGTAIIAAFAQDGPEWCSGLACTRYSPAAIQRELGPGFRLEESIPESHHTPSGTIQRFEYHRFTRMG
jgi:hypothetical protein